MNRREHLLKALAASCAVRLSPIEKTASDSSSKLAASRNFCAHSKLSSASVTCSLDEATAALNARTRPAYTTFAVR